MSPRISGATPAPAAAGLEPVRTSVNLEFGQVVVWLPPNADVQVHCHASIGDVDCLGQRGNRDGNADRNGPTADARVDSLGLDGLTGGRPLILDVTVGTGHVEVKR